MLILQRIFESILGTFYIIIFINIINIINNYMNSYYFNIFTIVINAVYFLNMLYFQKILHMRNMCNSIGGIIVLSPFI